MTAHVLVTGIPVNMTIRYQNNPNYEETRDTYTFRADFTDGNADPEVWGYGETPEKVTIR